MMCGDIVGKFDVNGNFYLRVTGANPDKAHEKLRIQRASDRVNMENGSNSVECPVRVNGAQAMPAPWLIQEGG